MRKVFFLIFLLSTFTTLRAQVNADEVEAMQYFQSGDFEKAAFLFQKVFNKNKDLNLYDPYFNSLLKSKQFNQAEKLTKSLIKENPNNFIFSVDLGRIYLEKNEQEKADEWFNSLIRTLPENEFAIRDLAITFYRAEAYDFSIKTLLSGRKLLNKKDAFIYDLLSLYRFKKDKLMIIQEYFNLLKINPEALRHSQIGIANIFEGKDDYSLLKTEILRFLQKEPQNTVMVELLIWQYIQQKEFDMALRQSISLERRLKENGSRVYQLSKIIAANNDFDQAIEALNYVIAKGSSSPFYITARIDLINVKHKKIKSQKSSIGDLIALEKEYISILTEFGENTETASAIRQLANLQAYQLNKSENAAEYLESLLMLPNLSKQYLAEIKLELADILILASEPWEATLLYGQVEKDFANEPLGHEAKFKNAQLAYFQGDFIWSKAQLDVLKSSTSQLIANDALNLSLLISTDLNTPSDSAALLKYAAADLLFFKNKNNEALTALDSIAILYPSTSLEDDILMLKSKIFLNNDAFDEAIEQLQKIINVHSEGLWVDDAIFSLAGIYEHKLNETAKAMDLYQKIINEYPGSLYLLEARQRYRFLRGDQLE